MAKENSISRFFRKNPLIRSLIRFLKSNSLPGFLGISIWDVLTFVYSELNKEDITIRATSMAFNFFLSIFPSLLLAIAIIPFIPVDGLQAIFYETVFNLLPSGAEQWLGETIKDITENQRGNLISGSLLMAFIFGSNGIFSMINGFEKSYNLTYHQRGFWQKRFLSIIMLMSVGAILIFACLLIILGEQIREFLIEHTQVNSINIFFIILFKWIFIFMLIYAMTTFIFRYAPAFKRKLRLINPGVTLSTIMIVSGTLLLSFYLNEWDTYNKVYGSIGAIIATMVWLNVNCLSLLAGYELNASIAINRDLRYHNVDAADLEKVGESA